MSDLIISAGASHVGQRAHNEDAFLVDDDLFLVADGVGGHQAGDVASRLTCEVVAREVSGSATLEEAIRAANTAVGDAARDDAARDNMATTVVAARFIGQNFLLAWVGDSRAYLWDGQLRLLTRDHSAVQGLVDDGQLSVEQAQEHPKRNVILQALGMQANDGLEIGLNRGGLGPGQLLLLCSDGVNDVVSAAELAGMLQNVATEITDRGATAIRNGVEALVDAAVNAGGRDNITAVMLACGPDAEAADADLPDIVWSFDPVSGEYSGLAKPAAGGSLLTGAGGPIAPRTQAGESPADETVLMSRETTSDDTPAELPPTNNRHKLVIWLVVAGVAVAALLYSLGLAGA